MEKILKPKKEFKNKRGITLVALIITIIIMLILAGVAISVVINGDSLFSKTREASDEYNRQSALEKFNMKMMNLDMKAMLDTGNVATLTELSKMVVPSDTTYYDKEIDKVEVAANNESAEVEMDGYTFIVDKNLNVTHINGSLAVTNPGGSSSSGGSGSSGNGSGTNTGGSSSGGTTGTPAESVVIPGTVSNITVKTVQGMVPVVYNETDTSWYVATAEQIANNSWFAYVDTSIEGNESKSQWANVMLMDNLKVDNNGTEVVVKDATSTAEYYGKKVTSEGSMYVWIPRYAYKITSGYHTDTVGTIDIKFLNTNNTYKDGSSTSTVLGNPFTTLPSVTNSYVVHPAFTWENESGNTVELEGIWIAKFEASATDGTFATAKNGQLATTVDTTTPANSVILRSVGNVSSWRTINLNQVYLNCYNMNSENTEAATGNAGIYGISTDKDIIDPHLIKNTEWGAAAYLAHSKYGRNKITGETMSNLTGYNTGNGNYKTNVGLSTTNNVYGIYDMAGGAWEHTAAYVDSTKGGTVANTYLTSTSYGKALYDAPSKYKDVYVAASSDDRVRNYSANAHMYGDAIFETSYTSYDGTNYPDSSWNGDYSAFSFASSPFFFRGGGYDGSAAAGVFAFSHNTGASNAKQGFRPALAIL